MANVIHTIEVFLSYAHIIGYFVQCFQRQHVQCTHCTHIIQTSNEEQFLLIYLRKDTFFTTKLFSLQ